MVATNSYVLDYSIQWKTYPWGDDDGDALAGYGHDCNHDDDNDEDDAGADDEDNDDCNWNPVPFLQQMITFVFPHE